MGQGVGVAPAVNGWAGRGDTDTSQSFWGVFLCEEKREPGSAGRKKSPWVFCHPWEGTKPTGSNGGKEKRKRGKIQEKKGGGSSEEKHAAFPPSPPAHPEEKGNFPFLLSFPPPSPQTFPARVAFCCAKSAPAYLASRPGVCGGGGRKAGRERREGAEPQEFLCCERCGRSSGFWGGFFPPLPERAGSGRG